MKKTMNKTYLSTILGLLSASILSPSTSKADLFKCSACPAGYSCDGKNKYQCAVNYYAAPGQSYCSKCPEGYYSIANRSKCGNKFVEYKTYTNTGISTLTIPTGYYKIEVAGAGGGGGGGIIKCGACSTKSYSSGGGGNGDLQTGYAYFSSNTSVTITVGAGGRGSSRSPCNDKKWGADGGTSSFISSVKTISAAGGKGGSSVHGWATNCKTGDSGSSAGNGQGGNGGDKCNGKCDDGKSGANGWVKIYKVTPACYNNGNC